MKKKTPIHKVYSFHSISSPHRFIEKVKEEAVKTNLNFEQVENGFDLQINSNHGGRIVYKANVSADDGGGSFASGEIITIPWNSKPEKKKNLFQKIVSAIWYIFLLPFLLFCLLCVGINMLFACLMHGTNIEQNNEETNEEKLCNFMKNKLCCTQMKE